MSALHICANAILSHLPPDTYLLGVQALSNKDGQELRKMRNNLGTALTRLQAWLDHNFVMCAEPDPAAQAASAAQEIGRIQHCTHKKSACSGGQQAFPFRAAPPFAHALHSYRWLTTCHAGLILTCTLVSPHCHSFFCCSKC